MAIDALASDRPDMSPPTTDSAGGAANAALDIEILRAVPERFAIKDENSANWLVRKIVESRQYAYRVKEWAEREQRRAEREEQTLMFLFGRQIENWTKGEIEKLNGRRKSLNLPAGTIGFRTINSSLQVDDEVRVLGWAKEHCGLAVVTVEKLSRSVLKDHFERTGEMPDEGAYIEPTGERLYIR